MLQPVALTVPLANLTQAIIDKFKQSLTLLQWVKTVRFGVLDCIYS